MKKGVARAGADQLLGRGEPGFLAPIARAGAHAGATGVARSRPGVPRRGQRDSTLATDRFCTLEVYQTETMGCMRLEKTLQSDVERLEHKLGFSVASSA